MNKKPGAEWTMGELIETGLWLDTGVDGAGRGGLMLGGLMLGGLMLGVIGGMLFELTGVVGIWRL